MRRSWRWAALACFGIMAVLLASASVANAQPSGIIGDALADLEALTGQSGKAHAGFPASPSS